MVQQLCTVSVIGGRDGDGARVRTLEALVRSRAARFATALGCWQLGRGGGGGGNDGAGDVV